MKTSEFKGQYVRAKKSFKDWHEKLTLCHMVLDSIDFLPANFKIRVQDYAPNYITIVAPDDMKIDGFTNWVRKITKQYLVDPDISIGSDLVATWWLYPRMKLNGNSSSVYQGVAIDLIVHNSERCEIITKTVEVEQSELTGYCKILKERKFLSEFVR